MSKSNINALTGLDVLRAESPGDPEVCVAILDGPVDLSHPCFEGARLTRLQTLVPGVASAGPASRPGTHITSVIFGQPGSPVQGIAPGCRGVLLPLFKDGAGEPLAPCSQLDLARGISQAVQEGAHIINISGGQFDPTGAADPILADAVRACAAHNVLIVAAVGNEGCACLHMPAALPAVLAVGAMNAEGTPLEFSNWGDAYQTQGLLAPGEGIRGAVPGGGVTTLSGTSFAAAVVSGVVALLLSLQRQGGFQPDPQAVRAALLESAYPCDPLEAVDCGRFLAGRLNISGAYERLAGGRKRDAPDDRAPHRDTYSGEGGYMLKAGDRAPDFAVEDHSGREVRLSDYTGQTVVLWFYPAADTPN